MIKIKNSHILSVGYILNILCCWVMSQKLLLNGFKWIEETSQFNDC